MSIKILIADDHKMFREGLRSMLEQEPGLEVIGEAKNGREIVHMANELNPEVVIMDITMPELNGIEATKLILNDNPGIKIITLSMHNDKRFITRALSAGAEGYLLKDNAFDELADAIHSITTNQIYLSKTITNTVYKDYITKLDKNIDFTASKVLSAREIEVLQLIAEGKSSKEIADKLCRSQKTIETHRRQIGDKLGLHTVAELTKYAITEGLTSL